ncbi:excisionase family DNA-binding protein [Streptomyces sp. NPDC054841]
MVVCVELLRMSKAAKRLGIHPMTLRQWALDGKIPFTWVGRERRFSSVDVKNMKRGSDSSTARPRLELLYVRVSGSSGQEFSLGAQEAECGPPRPVRSSRSSGTVARA